MVFRTLLLFLSLPLVHSHVPVFPYGTKESEPYQLKNIDTKSYGVYGELQATDIVWLEIEGSKGAEMTISLQKNSGGGVYDVAVWAEGDTLQNISCGNENWYGWAHQLGGHYFTRNLTELPDSVRSAIGSSSAFVLHGDGQEPSEFEPFGVGVYFPLAGCKDKFPRTTTYKMALVNPKEEEVNFSLGVGMEESFSLLELLLMPFVIFQTFLWSGRSAEAVVGIFAICLALVYTFKVVTLKSNSYSLLTRTASQTLRTYGLHFVWLAAAAFFANGVSFLFQLIFCFGLKPNLGSIVWVPILVHITIPIVLAIVVLLYYDARMAWGWKLLALFVGIWMLFFGWLSFLFFPVLYCVSVIMHLILGP